MGNDDVVMTMDVSQFEKSLSKVLSGFFNIEKETKKVSMTGKAITDTIGATQTQHAEKIKKSSETSAKGMTGAFVKGALIASAAIGAIKGVIHTVASNIPEIGQTFSIAKDIVMRNLLWPLRKELLPLLQGILNWVRDHRIVFVQAGAIIVNVFRTIKAIVMSFIDVVKGIWQHLAQGLEAIFGKTTRSITEVINIVLFKISAVAMFIMELLSPLFNWIADKIAFVVGLVTDMASGIMRTIGDLSTNLEDIINIFRDLGDVISASTGFANGLGKAFTILGEVLGMTVKPLLAGIAEILQAMVTSIDAVITTIKVAKAWLSNDTGSGRKAQAEFDRRQAKREQASSKRFGDVIENTKKGAGAVADTWNSNEVTAAGRVASRINNDNRQVTQNVSIHVAGSYDAKETASAISKELQRSKERAWTPQ